MTLPQPSHEMLVHQQQLLEAISLACFQNGGWLSFDLFMQMALYAPGLGYYSAGMHKFGPSGDFITAPEISPLFSQCLGAQCAQILANLSPDKRYILELGAGSGKMAAEVMLFLDEKEILPSQYWILEVSGDLKARQKAYLKDHCSKFYHKFVWLDSLPTQAFEGIILGNEVIDAMPVSLFQIGDDGQVLEGFVGKVDGEWQIKFDTPTTPSLYFAVEQLQERIGKLPQGYTSEIQLSLLPWMSALNACLEKGVMIFLDYGFSSQEYYHPQRNQGTLMCHYRHHAHPNPLAHIGLEDITAHVDFTALALSAHACQLELAGFTNQAAFLLGNGLLDLAQYAMQSTKTRFSASQQIQTLTAPHEMGELFKVIAFSKQYSAPLQGFSFLANRHRL